MIVIMIIIFRKFLQQFITVDKSLLSLNLISLKCIFYWLKYKIQGASCAKRKFNQLKKEISLCSK